MPRIAAPHASPASAPNATMPAKPFQVLWSPNSRRPSRSVLPPPIGRPQHARTGVFTHAMFATPATMAGSRLAYI